MRTTLVQLSKEAFSTHFIESLGVDHCVGEVGNLVSYTFQFSETFFLKINYSATAILYSFLSGNCFGEFGNIFFVAS